MIPKKEYKKCIEMIKEFIPRYKAAGRSYSDLVANLETAERDGEGPVDRSLDKDLQDLINIRQRNLKNNEAKALFSEALAIHNIYLASQFAAARGDLQNVIMTCSFAVGYFAKADAFKDGAEYMFDADSKAGEAQKAFLEQYNEKNTSK